MTVLYTTAVIHEILWFIFCLNLHLYILGHFFVLKILMRYEQYPRADIYFKKDKIG